MKKILVFVYTLLFGFSLLSFSNISYSDLPKNKETLIKLTFNGHQATAIMADNPTTQSLLAQLPVTVTFEDYASAEKIAYLPKTPSKQGVNGYTPKTGDITCYAPWGNLAIFYKDRAYSGGLIYMGKFVSGLDSFSQQGSKFNVTIERVE